MAAVLQFDRRAVHRVVADPTVLDLANDIDAEAQEIKALLDRAYLMALPTGDEGLMRVMRSINSKVIHVRVLVHQGLDLYAESNKVDPYLAVMAGSGPDAA